MVVFNGEMMLRTCAFKNKASKKSEVAPHGVHPELEPAIPALLDLCWARHLLAPES